MALDVKGGQIKETSYVEVSSKLAEFARIEYLLQLSLGTSAAVVTKIQTIAKSQVTLPFEKNVNKKKMQVIHSFVDMADLDLAKINEESLVNHGFPIGPSGRIFSTGLLKLEKSGAINYKVLLCKVAVGKSLCYPIGDEEDQSLKISMEKGSFDSVYFKHEEYENSAYYRYEYKVYDSTQVLPEYLIHFKFDETRESNAKVAFLDPGCEMQRDWMRQHRHFLLQKRPSLPLLHL